MNKSGNPKKSNEYFIRVKNIRDYLVKAVNETKLVFGSSITNEQLRIFGILFNEMTVSQILSQAVTNDKSHIVFTSHGDPTDNLKYALVGSGISSSGHIPITGIDYRFIFLTVSDDVVNKARQYRQQYGPIKDKIESVYNFLQTHPGAKEWDPNAYELVELFIRHNNVKESKGETSPQTEQQLKEIWENRKGNYRVNNLGTDNLSYRICEDCYNGVLSNQYIDVATRMALQEMADIDLIMSKKKRDGEEQKFNNNEKLKRLRNYIKASKIYGIDLSLYVALVTEIEGIDTSLPEDQNKLSH